VETSSLTKERYGALFEGSIGGSRLASVGRQSSF